MEPEKLNWPKPYKALNPGQPSLSWASSRIAPIQVRIPELLTRVLTSVEGLWRDISLLMEDREKAEGTISAIQETLGDELRLLAQIIPALEEVFDNLCEDINTSSNSQVDIISNPASSKNQLQFAFVRFFRVITKEFAPFVLLMDDLQWGQRTFS